MISVNLSYLRKVNGYSQEEVAERIGVSRQAVAKWEAGDTAPDLDNCLALAKLYNVTLDDLVQYDQEQSAGVPIAPKGRHMFGVVTVGERGQIVIPQKAREMFNLQPGDDLLILGDESQGLAMIKNEVFLDMIAKYQQKGGLLP